MKLGKYFLKIALCLWFSVPLFAQVQLGRNVQIGAGAGSGITLEQQVVPPISGQYVVVYPTVGVIDTDPVGNGVISAQGGKFQWQCSGILCNIAPSMTAHWTGFALPSYVDPASVTAVYADAMNSATQVNGAMPGGGSNTSQLSCSGMSGTATLFPSYTTPSNPWDLYEGTRSTTLTGSQVATASCHVQLGVSSLNSSGMIVNIPAIRLLVYYTGPPPPTDTAIQVVAPLCYDSSGRTLGDCANNRFIDGGTDSTVLTLHSSSTVSSALALQNSSSGSNFQFFTDGSGSSFPASIGIYNANTSHIPFRITSTDGVILSSLTAGTSPICPNGTGGALTTVGCAGGGGSSAWSALTNPTGNLSLTMGANTSTFTFNAATGSSDLFSLTDTASNTGTGILMHPHTASGSTEIPWQADANGVGWKVGANGALQGVGSSSTHGITLPIASALPSPTASAAGIFSDTSANLQAYENGGSFSRICTVGNGLCAGGGSGFPITLGSTSIAAGSTTTSVSGLTVNGVNLNAAGSSSLFLNQAGGYTAPSGGSGGQPGSCTTTVGNQICLTDSTYNASNQGATTTTTSGTTAPGTTVVVASASTWAVNQGIYIAGAGTAGANYIGTVTGISGTTFTVSPATSTSVATGTLVQHDDTAAFNAAITYLGTNGSGNIWLNDGKYLVNGPLLDTSGANAILPMPHILYASGVVQQVVIGIRGFVRSANFPTNSGVIIQTSVNSGNLIGAYYAAGPLPNFTNVLVDIENVHLRAPNNPSITLANLYWAAGAYLDNVYFETGTDGAGNLPTTGTGSGLIMPSLGNSSFSTANDLHLAGFATCVHAYEHMTSNDINESSCINGLVPDSTTGTPVYAGNGVHVDHFFCQLCTNQLQGGSNKATLQIDDMDLESTSSHGVNDPSNLIYGVVNFNVQASSGAVTPTNPAVNGASNLCIRNLQFPNGTSYGGACPAVGVSSVFTRTGAVTAQTGDYTVSQVTGAAPLASPTFTGTANFAQMFNAGRNAQTGTSYTIVATDENKTLTFSNASPVAVTLPQATTSGFTSGAIFNVVNLGAGNATITPSTSTINGAATLVLATGQSARITSDGTNYTAELGAGSGAGVTGTAPIVVSGSNISCPTCSTGTGTNVTVNGGSALGTANLSDSTPAAPAGYTNVKWQNSGSNVSGYVPTVSVPTYVQENLPQSGSGNVSSFVETFPQALASSGNTAFIVMACDGSSAVTPPTGWTVDLNVAATTFSRLIVIHKATAGETSVTWGVASASSFSGWFFELKGSHTFDQSATGTSGNATSVTFPSITPSAGAIVFGASTYTLNVGGGDLYTAGQAVGAASPQWKVYGSGAPNTNARTLTGVVETIPANNVVTLPPSILFPSGNTQISGGGVAYATFSIL